MALEVVLCALGIMNAYGSMQVTIWWLCHAAALLWKVRFPLHARSFTLNKKDRYIHCFCLLVGLVLPLIAVLAIIADSAVQYKSNELYIYIHWNGVWKRIDDIRSMLWSDKGSPICIIILPGHHNKYNNIADHFGLLLHLQSKF